mmetsp:Transcript_22029/g.37457  ORF Transcript_22029/g.37457 Transcript_22029/m.37457 type:complete len:145 (+) Transcript_22029:1090-1524(+)
MTPNSFADRRRSEWPLHVWNLCTKIRCNKKVTKSTWIGKHTQKAPDVLATSAGRNLQTDIDASHPKSMPPQTLYRSLVREARKIKDYNFRSYALRRMKAGFVKNRNLQGEEASAAIHDGKEQLEVLKRQAILSQLYPSARSVME